MLVQTLSQTVRHAGRALGVALAFMVCAACHRAPDAAHPPQILDGLPPGTYAWFETNRTAPEGGNQFVVQLFTDRAPVSASQFTGLANGTQPFYDLTTEKKKTGYFYDGLLFHRIEGGILIQGGDPLGTGAGGPGYVYQAIPQPDSTYDKPYLLGLASRDGNKQNGSQFFITLAPMPQINGRFTLLGEVVRGQDVVETIGKAVINRFNAGVPLEPQIMRYVRVYTVPADGPARLAEAAPIADAQTTLTLRSVLLKPGNE